MITRRSLIGSMAAFIAAPAIVRASSLMAISVQPEYINWPMSDEWADRLINPPLIPDWLQEAATWEYSKMVADMMLFGSGALEIDLNKGVRHVPINQIIRHV